MSKMGAWSFMLLSYLFLGDKYSVLDKQKQTNKEVVFFFFFFQVSITMHNLFLRKLSMCLLREDKPEPGESY